MISLVLDFLLVMSPFKGPKQNKRKQLCVQNGTMSPIKPCGVEFTRRGTSKCFVTLISVLGSGTKDQTKQKERV